MVASVVLLLAKGAADYFVTGKETPGQLAGKFLLFGGYGLYEYWRENQKEKESAASSSTASELEVRTGIRPAAHVIGRARVGPADHMLAYASVQHLANDRRQLHLVQVLSEGHCEGVERVWIDGYEAMRGSPDGAKQALTVSPAVNWQTRYVQIFDEEAAAGADTVTAHRNTLQRMDLEPEYRFRAIQLTPSNAAGIPGDARFAYYDRGRRTNYSVADWGPWCGATIYPNGINGDTSSLGALADDEEWKASEYLFEGKCVSHIWLEKSNFDAPFGGSIPNIEYQVKGRRLQWPKPDGTLGDPQWTENAAAVRYWFHTKLEDIPPAKIDTAEFVDAYNKCGERLALNDPQDSIPDEWTGATYNSPLIRYSTNGIFLQDPGRYDNYRAGQDMAWQGHVVESRGKLLFRPGYERPIAFSIGPENIVSTGSFNPLPAINDRVNAVRTSIPQSLDNNFESLDLDPVIDPSAEDGTDRYLERELQGLQFIKYPLNAMNLLHIFLRRGRAAGRLNLNIQIDPADFEGATYPQINALDRVSVTHPTLGLTDSPWEVIAWRRNDDWTINVELREAPEGIYDDTAVLPPRRQRPLDLPNPTTPPAPPAGVSATPFAGILADGTLRLHIEAKWTASDLATEITVINSTDTYEDVHVISPFHDITEIDVPAVDSYTLEFRHVNEYGRRSSPVEAAATIDTSGLKPPAPRYQRHEVRDETLTIFFHPFPPSNYDISGIDFRYALRDLQSTTAFPAVTTDAQWNALTRLQADAVIPAAAGESFSAGLAIPFQGRYRIYARSVTRQGLRSDIADLGTYILQGSRPADGTIDLEPDFAGTLTNIDRLWAHDFVSGGEQYDLAEVLVRDRPTASALTFNDWNGANGWPFGVTDPARYVANPAITFPAQGTYLVRYELDLWTPPGATITPAATVQYQGRVSGAAAGGLIAAGDGTAFQRLLNVNEVEVRVTITTRDTAILGMRLFYITA